MCAARLFMSKQKKKKEEEERKRLAKLENDFEQGLTDFENIPNYVSLPPEGHLKFHGWTMLMKEINRKIHLNHMKQAWIESNQEAWIESNMEALVTDDADTHYDSVEIIEINKGGRDKGRRKSEKELPNKDPKSRGGQRQVC